MRRREFLKALVAGSAAAMLGAAPRLLEDRGWRLRLTALPDGKVLLFGMEVVPCEGFAVWELDTEPPTKWELVWSGRWQLARQQAAIVESTEPPRFHGGEP